MLAGPASPAAGPAPYRSALPRGQAAGAPRPAPAAAARRSLAGQPAAGPPAATTPAAAQAGHLDRRARADGPDLPQGHRVPGPDGAVRRPPPGRSQRPPAQRAVRLAVAGGHDRDHHEHRSRSLGPAEDRGHLPARAGPGELRLLLHPQGVQEHRPVAVLVRQHVLRGRARLCHRGPQPRPGLVDAGGGTLPAPGAQPPGGWEARPRRGAMVLPQPRLPQTVHDITIDNIPSHPIDTQHSWTYPGFGCGVVLRPQFSGRRAISAGAADRVLQGHAMRRR